jgi:transposase-like protein
VDDVEIAILAAWKRIKPGLLADRAELARRLGRSRSKTLRKWPRAWCLAIRAGDLRLERIAMVYGHQRTGRPEHAGAERAGQVAHKIRLTAQAVKKLCARVRIVPGESVPGLAARLGVRPAALRTWRIKGRFDVQHRCGGRGKPKAFVYSDKELDPCAHGLEVSDEAWTWTATFLANRVPESFEHSIERVPVFRGRGPSYRDKSELHPEHPEVDRPAKPPFKRLGPPQPDLLAWYKWKDGEFVGYDWRNERARIGYERHERVKAMGRGYYAKAKLEGRRRRSTAKGSLRFWGWRWICPGCGRQARVLFLPVGGVNLIPAGDLPARLYAKPPELRFACVECHGLVRLSRVNADFWNSVVKYLSGGLLYGREVPRPEWLKADRKHRFGLRPRREPSARREQVKERLLRGWSYKRIAADLGISPRTVSVCVWRIYAQHGVHSRLDLGRALGADLEPLWSKRARIAQRVALGQSRRQIARDLLRIADQCTRKITAP